MDERYQLFQADADVRTSWYILDTETDKVAMVDGERAQGMTRWEARQVLAHLQHKEQVQPEGFWLDGGNTFMPRDVWEKALGEAEGKELPLRDRPGGEVIGTATVGRNGQFHFSITDPVMRKVVDDAMKFRDEHLSIYSEPKERVWATSPGAQEVVDQMFRLPLTDAHIDRIMSSTEKVK